jgi:hypothetical protein
MNKVLNSESFWIFGEWLTVSNILQLGKNW